MRVSTALQVILAGKIRANGLGGGLQAKCRGSWCKVGWVLRPIALGFGGHVLLFGDQIVNALLVLNHLCFFVSLVEIFNYI